VVELGELVKEVEEYKTRSNASKAENPHHLEKE